MVLGTKPPSQDSTALNAFTVDVEDWYQGIELPFSSWKDYPPRLEIGLKRILELLEQYHVRATFFVLGWIAKEYPALVKAIGDRGHELGSHGFSHEKFYNLSTDSLREEIRGTRQRLQDLSGQEVVVHRSPFYSITSQNLWAFKVLREEGFTVDSSVSPVKTWRYGISTCPDEIFYIEDVQIIEFPISSFKILNRKWAIGGAYFRILPYFLTQRALLNRQRKGKNTMFYVHPWEYDPEHPLAPMEWKAKVTHYARLGKTFIYTKNLLKGFRFDTVSGVVDNLVDRKGLRNVSINLLKD